MREASKVRGLGPGYVGRRWLPALLLSGVVGFAGCSGPVACGAIKRLMYEEPWRDRYQKKDEVVAALALAPGDRVADLGAGGGYFTFPIAEQVGETGRVYAIDIDTSLLAYVEHQAGKRGLEQIVTVQAPEDGPGLEPASVDLVFLSNVFHHLPDPERYFRNARPVLRRGGRLAILEAREGSHGTDPDRIVSALEAAGFTLAKRHTFIEQQSFQVFVPVDEVAGAE